jgi:hypothetical protein
MAKRTWVAKMNCMMPFRDFAKGESIILDDSEVTPRVKALFECEDPPEEKDNDPDLRVMVARLKAAKIPIPRGAKNVTIKELFDTFLVKGSLASSIAGDAPAGEIPPDNTKDGSSSDGLRSQNGDGGEAGKATPANGENKGEAEK